MDKRKIFIHIPKNAGMTIRHSPHLKRKILLNHKSRLINSKYAGDVARKMKQTGDHHGYEHARWRDLAHDYRKTHTAFAIIRNPWDRVKSRYHFIKDMNIDVDETDAKERRKRLKVLRNPQEKTTTSREAYYYWLRNKFNGLNKQSVEYSALFLILNKTGFRGLFRESSNGFNVPFGNYKTVNVITKERLNEIHDMIKDVTFVCCDFTESMKRIQEGDFVYLDPPYAPENEHSFVGYNQDGFGNHETLFELTKKQPAKFVMSNSNVKLVIDKFKEYTIDVVEAKRAINSKKPGAKTLEVIINN